MIGFLLVIRLFIEPTQRSLTVDDQNTHAGSPQPKSKGLKNETRENPIASASMRALLIGNSF